MYVSNKCIVFIYKVIGVTIYYLEIIRR